MRHSGATSEQQICARRVVGGKWIARWKNRASNGGSEPHSPRSNGIAGFVRKSQPRAENSFTVACALERDCRASAETYPALARCLQIHTWQERRKRLF